MEDNNLAQCWQDFDAVLGAGLSRVLLYGPSGTGKTFAALTSKVGAGGAYRLTCTEDMTTADVEGAFMPAKEGFEFLAGAGLQSWQGNGEIGGRLVVDEVDRASGDVLGKLLAFTDSPESCSFLHPVTGQVIRPLAGFSVVMTTNLDDPDDLNPALRDRFSVAINANRAHVAALSKLSADLQPVAAGVIGRSDGGRYLSLRAFYDFDLLRVTLGDFDAARLTFGNRSAAILDALQVNAVAL